MIMLGNNIIILLKKKLFLWCDGLLFPLQDYYRSHAYCYRVVIRAIPGKSAGKWI